MGKGGSVSVREGIVMSQDAPVNTGAGSWPELLSAEFAVARMQAKLHLWAARDAGRRFGDLFNLVYDPAFLVVAWERVATNKAPALREGYSFILLPGCFPKVTLVTGLEKFIHISTAQDEHFLRMAIRPGHGNGSSI